LNQLNELSGHVSGIKANQKYCYTDPVLLH